MSDAAAASAAAAVLEKKQPEEAEAEEEEASGGEEEGDVSTSGDGTGGAAGGDKKKRKKKRKKKEQGGGGGGASAAAATIAIPAVFQPNLRVAPAPPTPPKSKSSSKPGPDEAPTGRVALAARPLKEGELVFEEAPVALAVFQSPNKPRCGYCGRDRPAGQGQVGEAAAGCVPVPCSAACGASDLAAAYQLAGPALALVGDVAKESDCEAQLLTLVLVLACLKHMHGEKQKQEEGEEDEAATPAAAKGKGKGKDQGQPWCAGWCGVAGLMDHRERMAPAFLAAVGGALAKLWPLLPEAVRVSVGPPEGEGVRLACVVNVNSHGCVPPKQNKTKQNKTKQKATQNETKQATQHNTRQDKPKRNKKQHNTKLPGPHPPPTTTTTTH